MSCDCARCVVMNVCADCGGAIPDSETRHFLPVTVSVSLLEQRDELRGPFCDGCAACRVAAV